MPLCPSHWTTLFSAIRSGAVRRMSFYGVNFSALNDDAFLAAIGCRGLQSLTIESSYVPSGCFTDDLVRSSYAKRLLQLQFSENNKSHRLSDDAVLDFYLPTDASPGGQSRCFILEGSGVTDLFLAKCFEVSIFHFAFQYLKFRRKMQRFSVSDRAHHDHLVV